MKLQREEPRTRGLLTTVTFRWDEALQRRAQNARPVDNSYLSLQCSSTGNSYHNLGVHTPRDDEWPNTKKFLPSFRLFPSSVELPCAFQRNDFWGLSLMRLSESITKLHYPKGAHREERWGNCLTLRVRWGNKEHFKQDTALNQRNVAEGKWSTTMPWKEAIQFRIITHVAVNIINSTQK